MASEKQEVADPADWRPQESGV